MSDELEGVGEEANVLTPDRRELPRTPWTRNVRWRARGRGFEGNGVLGLGARRTRAGWKCVRRWGGRGCLNLGVISVRIHGLPRTREPSTPLHRMYQIERPTQTHAAYQLRK
ncbi:hypothetical protein GQ55_9G384700 [Panicum hallii var. hallii]|uniref:Uncharacterized protein n=1 Tax=Panicum hallii var. hallii TaxID=1504633 RepID=A0A2T7C9D2_9POAL|nr:hypothetical protein GQ55_9G384700 [Panicum hallii var. hallii]